MLGRVLGRLSFLLGYWILCSIGQNREIEVEHEDTQLQPSLCIISTQSLMLIIKEQQDRSLSLSAVYSSELKFGTQEDNRKSVRDIYCTSLRHIGLMLHKRNWISYVWLVCAAVSLLLMTYGALKNSTPHASQA